MLLTSAHAKHNATLLNALYYKQLRLALDHLQLLVVLKKLPELRQKHSDPERHLRAPPFHRVTEDARFLVMDVAKCHHQLGVGDEGVAGLVCNPNTKLHILKAACRTVRSVVSNTTLHASV